MLRNINYLWIWDVEARIWAENQMRVNRYFSYTVPVNVKSIENTAFKNSLAT